MLKGSAKLDVPVYSDDPNDLDQDKDPIMHGVDLLPEDLEQDASDPSIYRGQRDFPPVKITVSVRPDGSTFITTEPNSGVVENTLHI